MKDEIQALLQLQPQEDSGKAVVTNQSGESGPPAKQGKLLQLIKRRM